MNDISNSSNNPSKKTIDFLLNYSSVILFTVILCVISGISPRFFSIRNILNVLNQASTLGFLAIGITAVFITGGIDLSMPPVMALSAILSAMAMQSGANTFVAIVIVLVVGCLCGFINGYAVGYLKMIPFVVTLSVQVIAMGLCILLTSKVSIPITNETYIKLFNGKIYGLPVSILYLVIAVVVTMIIAKKSFYGRWVYATGVNINTSRISGIPTNMVLVAVYVWAGLFAGFAALLVSSRLSSASATLGQEGLVLNIVSAAVVGGVSTAGGFGSTLGAVFGALIITLISNSMNMMQISYYTTLWVKGIVIIVFVGLDYFRRKR